MSSKRHLLLAAVVASIILILASTVLIDGTGQGQSDWPAASPPGGDPGPTERDTVRSVILFIGDGMGDGQRRAARWSSVGQDGALAMDDMPVHGWSRTASADNRITDSAAGATALATGVKTNNGMIAMDARSRTLTTILERAQSAGLSVGLVTTTQLSDATPASFVAHVPDRSQRIEIARQMAGSRVDVLLGGGEDDFLPETVAGCYPGTGKRLDGRNLIEEARANGYTYVCTPLDFEAVESAPTDRLLGLFADEVMGRPFAPSLAQMTQKAIDILSRDPDGFFLMVEGGQIDKAGHAGDAANAIGDTVGLDQAVAAARSYAQAASDTLVVVTADHETGGMRARLDRGGLWVRPRPFLMPEGLPFYVTLLTRAHTAADVPTTALGPWSELLSGTYENTHIHDVMRRAIE